MSIDKKKFARVYLKAEDRFFRRVLGEIETNLGGTRKASARTACAKATYSILAIEAQHLLHKLEMAAQYNGQEVEDLIAGEDYV